MKGLTGMFFRYNEIVYEILTEPFVEDQQNYILVKDASIKTVAMFRITELCGLKLSKDRYGSCLYEK